ncbi:hypothetical protein FJY94_02010 [Candidatus Kaiserbacteria bacterium]|nr:hypothetical protein [Candidatus Kaiserbacteria bacterium]
MAWKVTSYTGAQKREAFEAAIRRCRKQKRASLQDVLMSVRGIKADVMRKFVVGLDEAALDELGICLERKGRNGPVTVVFTELPQPSITDRESVAA